MTACRGGCTRTLYAPLCLAAAAAGRRPLERLDARHLVGADSAFLDRETHTCRPRPLHRRLARSSTVARWMAFSATANAPAAAWSSTASIDEKQLWRRRCRRMALRLRRCTSFTSANSQRFTTTIELLS